MLLLSPIFLSGQNAETSEIARTYLIQNHEDLGLTLNDVQEVIISDQYVSDHNGRTHIYLSQAHIGHKVNGAMITMTLRKDKSVLSIGNRFVNDFSAKIVSGKMSLSADQAISKVGEHLGYTEFFPPVQNRTPGQYRQEFTSPDFSNSKIFAEAKYLEVNPSEYRLTWEVYLSERDNDNSWSAYVDASSGEVLSKEQNTIKCKMHPNAYHNPHTGCSGKGHHHDASEQKAVAQSAAAAGDGSAYYVCALPAESPIHGPFTLVSEPALENASPFGWHDEDGVEGAEWTITRGNNAHAYEDSDADNASAGNEPDVGDGLQFNFPWDENASILENVNSDITGLFYMSNMVHDFAYQVGFTEPAGAFQNNNFGKGGAGNDQVLSEAIDGDGTNNANFTLAPDGSNGRIQMFRWEYTAGVFRITEPSIVEGGYENNYPNWNPNQPLAADVNVSAELVEASDSNPQPDRAAQGCGELITDMVGKIAVIQRGGCDFSLKVFNAQEAGAVAAIICNQAGINGGDGSELINMGPGDRAEDVRIPAVFLNLESCTKIRNAMSTEPVIAEFKLSEPDGPTERSGGFDNGVIAHEYMHGISSRLVGGPSNIGCLRNEEQQGEGLSDYLALVMTAEPGDTGADARGIGNYVSGRPADGGGIRRFPYSTDISICPLTYDDIKGNRDAAGDVIPHPVGELWAAVLWDIYWAFVDLYGWDADWNNLDSGNMRAVQLAFDAMKMAPCGPGYLDMRQSVFDADDGQHTCLLWEIFARRGLGFFADQGDANNIDDGTEDFEVMPTCIVALKIKKETETLITAGDEMTVNFRVDNHTLETATNVIVTDILDEGMSVASVPSSISYTQNGNEVIFELGDIASLEGMNFSYQVATDPTKVSTTLMLNQVETNEERGAFEIDRAEGSANNFWEVNARDKRSGVTSFFAQERDEEAKQHLTLKDLPISGTRPTLRYWHRMNSDIIERGGFVEYSTDKVIFNSVEDKFVRGGYNSTLAYANFTQPALNGHSGKNPEGQFTDSYIDLTDEKGQNLDIRFVFGTYDINNDGEETIFFGDDDGWFIDDFELMDLKTYKTVATISADNADTQTTEVIETIIDSDGMVGVEDLETLGMSIELFPNPADDLATIRIISENKMYARIELSTIEGKTMMNKSIEILDSNNLYNLDLAQYDTGVYLVQVISGDRITTKKLIIE